MPEWSEAMGSILIIVVAVLVLGELLEHLVLPLLCYRKLRHRRPLIGRRSFVGKTARVVRWREHAGTVLVEGEYWQARSSRILKPDQKVRITALEALQLMVDEIDPIGPDRR